MSTTYSFHSPIFLHHQSPRSGSPGPEPCPPLCGLRAELLQSITLYFLTILTRHVRCVRVQKLWILSKTGFTIDPLVYAYPNLQDFRVEIFDYGEFYTLRDAEHFRGANKTFLSHDVLPWPKLRKPTRGILALYNLAVACHIGHLVVGMVRLNSKINFFLWFPMPGLSDSPLLSLITSS